MTFLVGWHVPCIPSVCWWFSMSVTGFENMRCCVRARHLYLYPVTSFHASLAMKYVVHFSKHRSLCKPSSSYISLILIEFQLYFIIYSHNLGIFKTGTSGLDHIEVQTMYCTFSHIVTWFTQINLFKTIMTMFSPSRFVEGMFYR